MRFCINTSNNRVNKVFDDSKYLIIKGTGGYIGKTELKDGLIHEWVLDSDKLIQYYCATNNGTDCSGKIYVGTRAYKR